MSSDAEATFLFADIAGFTALTEAHGDEEAVQLVEEFASAFIAFRAAFPVNNALIARGRGHAAVHAYH